MKFEYVEDQKFFSEILSSVGGIEKNLDLFDFREPNIKRREFSQIRNKVFENLKKTFGNVCQLRLHADCSDSADQVDHLIPLSSNELNKHLRSMRGEGGKKVKTQSFGSNNSKNLILACTRCNAFKKHKFPEMHVLEQVLSHEESD